MNYAQKLEYLNNAQIPYKDKVSKMTQLFTQEENILWAIKCAESVLHIFEKQHPKDKRPRLALEAAEAYLKNPCEETKKAASAAANAAASAASAAYAAYAAYAAAYAASAAAYAASAAVDEKQQEQKNIQFMIEVVERFKIFAELGD